MTVEQVSTTNEFLSGKVHLITLNSIHDPRGSLLPIEFTDLPFAPSRLFMVTGNQQNVVRGGHGHRHGCQLLICQQGLLEIELHYRKEVVRIKLKPEHEGLLVKENVWHSQRYLVENSIMLVLASDPYDPDSYFYEKSDAV